MDKTVSLIVWAPLRKSLLAYRYPTSVNECMEDCLTFAYSIGNQRLMCITCAKCRPYFICALLLESQNYE